MKVKVFAAAVLSAALLYNPAFAQAVDPHAGHSAHGASTAQSGEMLTGSVPVNNAVLTAAPRTLALTFAHPVMLQTVAITGPGGTTVGATFRRPQTPTPTYSIALPTLADGAYHVRWSATGDGHEMSGELHFTVQ